MRVAVADDAALMREGVARLLTDAAFEVTAKARDADELLRLIAQGSLNSLFGERGCL